MSKKARGRVDIIVRKIMELNALYHTAALLSGLSDGELNILSVLFDSGDEYSQQDFCDLFSLSRQTVNSIVSGLNKKGLVTLTHCPGTRSRKNVLLTDSGKRFCMERVAWLSAAEQKALDALAPADVDANIAMLEKYTQRLREEIEKKQAVEE